MANQRTPIDIKIEDLDHAPWNPRHTIEPKDVADLTASIKADGLIQRLVVIVNAHLGKYYVICGNRRLVACKAAGVEVVPCEILNVDEQTARRLTLIENLQREDADPILEAGLIERLVDDGMTIEAIAAETGRGEKWVWRRKQLTKLAPAWREFAERHDVTVDCLERIASYPSAVQDAAKKELPRDRSGTFRWSDIDWAFRRFSHRIDGAPFDTRACKRCGANSKNAPMLFDLDRGVKIGECLNGTCFDKKLLEYYEDEIIAARKAGAKVISVAEQWKIPVSWMATPKRTERNNVLYVVRPAGVISTVLWSIEEKHEPASNAESAKAEAELQRVRKLKRKTAKKLADWMGEHEEEFALAVNGVVKHEDPVTYLLRVSLLAHVFHAHDVTTGLSTAQLSLDLATGNPDGVTVDEKEFAAELSCSIREGLCEYDCEDAASRLTCVFPAYVAEALTPEEILLFWEGDGK